MEDMNISLMDDDGCMGGIATAHFKNTHPLVQATLVSAAVCLNTHFDVILHAVGLVQSSK